MLELHRLLFLAARFERGKIFLALDSYAGKNTDRIVFHLLDQGAEHFKCLALVFLLGVLLCVRTQANPLAKMIHRRKMLFPVEIQLAQHDLFLNAAHQVWSDLTDFLLVGVANFFDTTICNRFRGQGSVFPNPSRHVRTDANSDSRTLLSPSASHISSRLPGGMC